VLKGVFGLDIRDILSCLQKQPKRKIEKCQKSTFPKVDVKKHQPEPFGQFMLFSMISPKTQTALAAQP
jgi:hypothetical protein